VVPAERLQLPIGSAEHVDTAIALHQDGHFAVVQAAFPRRQKDLFRMFQKGAHELLIARTAGIVNSRRLALDGFEAPRSRNYPPGRKGIRRVRAMTKTVSVIGIETAEIRWIRMLVSLLRHPDPSVPELARQALLYLTDAAGKCATSHPETLNHAG
jgi:hypothetical protein